MGPGCERSFFETVSSVLTYFRQEVGFVIPPTPACVDTFIFTCALSIGLSSVGRRGAVLVVGILVGPTILSFSALWMAALLASFLEMWSSSQCDCPHPPPPPPQPCSQEALDTAIPGIRGPFDSLDCKGAWQSPHLMPCYTDDFWPSAASPQSTVCCGLARLQGEAAPRLPAAPST